MLKLTISKDALASFRAALCTDQSIDPGEGGWTFDKMMMLAGLCQLLPLSMDSKRLPALSYKAQAALDRNPVVPGDGTGADFEILDADVIAATVCCRYAAHSLERGYWDGEIATQVVGVGLSTRDWEVDVHPVAGAEIDVGKIMGILPIGRSDEPLPSPPLGNAVTGLLNAAHTVQGSLEYLAQAMDRTAFRDAVVSVQPQQAEDALNQLLELAKEQWQLVQQLETPPKQTE